MAEAELALLAEVLARELALLEGLLATGRGLTRLLLAQQPDRVDEAARGMGQQVEDLYGLEAQRLQLQGRVAAALGLVGEGPSLIRLSLAVSPRWREPLAELAAACAGRLVALQQVQAVNRELVQQAAAFSGLLLDILSGSGGPGVYGPGGLTGPRELPAGAAVLDQRA